MVIIARDRKKELNDFAGNLLLETIELIFQTIHRCRLFVYLLTEKLSGKLSHFLCDDAALLLSSNHNLESVKIRQRCSLPLGS